jgi:serine phosphatase RsbU (regulator of sigma subunit)
MEDLYYKYLKLSSGDNIICMTADDCEDIYDKKTIKVTQPVILSAIRMPSSRGVVESYIMYPLFSFTADEIYTIPTSQIVLVINIKENLKENYLTYLSERDEQEDVLVQDDDEDEIEEETIEEFLNRLGDETNEEKENQEYGDGIITGRVSRNTKRLH